MTHPCLKSTLEKRSFLTVFILIVMGAFYIPVHSQNQNTDIRPHAQRVVGDALRAEFSGVKHVGEYNFTREGQSQNTYTEMHYDTGRVLYKEGGVENTGAWFILDDTLCFVYKNDRMSNGCFRVYKVKNCFYHYSDQIPETKNELDQEYWTARSVKDGQTPQCDAPMS
ncbi:hypothetical protein DES40_0619 [Litorimonas taeanensis]|uniref:Uncharacterized protein n=1 Tax=Litorimonas taeanensis TaxID=568099 RepID=A0A420WK41_9PROT|nr:hypothetical protein [Litorimonas taeanensis]RKQ71306.1 hypothetical protein DES40_0619 [Litorimonas taeanensis]